MDEQLLKRVQDLVAEETGVPPRALVPGTRLLHDFGVFGFDAETLVRRFAETFGVDLTRFDFRRYFHDEPHLLNPAPLWWGLVAHRRAPKRPLTAAMLVRAAERSRWEDDGADSAAPAA